MDLCANSGNFKIKAPSVPKHNRLMAKSAYSITQTVTVNLLMLPEA